jgi:hypothetical protein
MVESLSYVLLLSMVPEGVCPVIAVTMDLVAA